MQYNNSINDYIDLAIHVIIRLNKKIFHFLHFAHFLTHVLYLQILNAENFFKVICINCRRGINSIW